MKRMGMVIGIRPERIAEYKRTHAAVWPEVLAKISDCNIRNYTIFLREPENLLFGYFEYHGDDWAADAAKMAADPRTQDWWAIHEPMQAPLDTRKQGRLVGDDRGGVPSRLSGASDDLRSRLRSARRGRRRRARRPIVTIGAGSIVADAHFPAYRKAGFPDRRRLRSRLGAGETRRRAIRWSRSLARSTRPLATEGAIFDLATPPGAHTSRARARSRRLRAFSSRSRWARDSSEATAILAVCRERQLVAAVNFQLRFAPMMLAVQGRARPRAARAARRCRGPSRGRHALESVRLPEGTAARRDRGPFDPLSRSHPRLPRRSDGRARQDDRPSPRPTWRRPARPRSSTMATRSAAALSINHNHAFGRKHQVAEFRFDGTEGAAHAKLGLLLDYPRGEPDELWIRPRARRNGPRFRSRGSGSPTPSSAEWRICSVSAPARTPCSIASVEDAWTTMALVEAAFESSAKPATLLKAHP